MVFGICHYSPLDVDIMLPEGLTRTLNPQETSDVCYVSAYQPTKSKFTFVFSTIDELKKVEKCPILDLDKNGFPTILKADTIRKALTVKSSKPRKVKKNGRKK